MTGTTRNIIANLHLETRGGLLRVSLEWCAAARGPSVRTGFESRFAAETNHRAHTTLSVFVAWENSLDRAKSESTIGHSPRERNSASRNRHTGITVVKQASITLTANRPDFRSWVKTRYRDVATPPPRRHR